MARTQMRLDALTGSYGTGAVQISDQGSAQATGSINATDLSTVLSNVASAIKRIHGFNSFTEAKAGVFNQSLTVTGSVSLKNASGVEQVSLNGTTGVISGSGALQAGGNLVLNGNALITGSVYLNNQASAPTATTGQAVIYSRAGTLYFKNQDNVETAVGGSGASGAFFSSTTAGSIFTTGSAAFVGTEAGVDAPSDKGTDVFFYVSGANDDTNTALFGGSIVSSGSYIRVVDAGNVVAYMDNTGYISGASGLSIGGAGYFAGNVVLEGASTAVNFTNNTFGNLQGLEWGSGAVTFLHQVMGGVGQGNRVTLYGADLKVENNNISGSSGLNIVLGSSGLVSTVGDLKVGGNDIQASDGTTALTLTAATGDVAVAGKLTVTGNQISGSAGGNITLQSSGDVEILGDLRVTGGDIKSSTATVFTLAGANATAAGNLTVTGDFTVNGTTVTVDSTNVAIYDPILILGSSSAGVAPSGDRGIIFASGSITQDNPVFYFDLATDGFRLAFTDDEGAGTTNITETGLANLTVNTITATTIAGGSTTLGDIQIDVNDGYVESINSKQLKLRSAFDRVVVDDNLGVSGSVRIVDGSGVQQILLNNSTGGVSGSGNFAAGGTLTVAGTSDLVGNVTVTGDVAVNGGDLTTTATTFNLVNANATTLNFAGGASTALNIGNSAGTNTVSGRTLFSQGLSGSLTKLTDGTSYLIAGTNIGIVTGSNGAITISSTAAAQSSFFSSTTAGAVFTTGSTAFVGAEAGIDAPADKGNDVFFYVSGSTAGGSGVALFGGNVRTSGSLTVDGNTTLGDASGDTVTVNGTTTFVGSGVTTTFAGDIAVNGGDVTTSAATFNLVNATATTVNFAGAATTLSVGAAGGSSTFNGNVTGSNFLMSGDLALNGGDLTTTAATFNLVDATATTVNFARAATTLVAGASGGSTTFQGNVTGSNFLVSGDLTVNGGDIDLRNAASGINLIDNNSSALSVKAGAASMVVFDTTNSAEKLKLLDDVTLSVGNGDDFTIVHNGTNTLVKNTTGFLSISGSNNVALQAGSNLYLLDVYKPASWSDANGIKLSSQASDWTAFENLYGEVSLLQGITANGAAGKFSRVATGTTAANADFQITGLDFSVIPAGARTGRLDIFVNGQLQLSGTSDDYVLGTSPDNVKFTYDIIADNTVIAIVR